MDIIGLSMDIHGSSRDIHEYQRISVEDFVLVALWWTPIKCPLPMSITVYYYTFLTF